MRLNYFNRSKADLDDELLKAAITAGHVPPGCLLGGTLVQRAVDQGEDPCATCACPKREACGGRPAVAVQASSEEDLREARGITNDEASVRKMLRKSYAKTLLTWMSEEK